MVYVASNHVRILSYVPDTFIIYNKTLSGKKTLMCYRFAHHVTNKMQLIEGFNITDHISVMKKISE